jgi:hypothetical protein
MFNGESLKGLANNRSVLINTRLQPGANNAEDFNRFSGLSRTFKPLKRLAFVAPNKHPAETGC